jgi:hypothetical protein
MDQAMNSGAVLMEDEEFDRWNINKLEPANSDERMRWRQDGFRVDEFGKPIFADKTAPRHWLIKVK